MPPQELTRHAMYDLVWSRPMRKVAEELGISDVALKKICDKHRVPTPPRGYWAKKEAGKPVREVWLHETADPQDEHIVIHGSRNLLAPETRQVLDQERERRKARPKPQPRTEALPVPPVEDIHPSVAATARALRKANPDKDDVVRATGQGHCGIEVGASSVERAIALLDGIARALEARSLKMAPTGSSMCVSVPPDAVTFSLTEQIEKRNHTPTMEELAKEDHLRKKQERDSLRGIWSFNRERAYPEFDFIRTGQFTIQIADEYVRGGLRRNWKDGKHQKLENLTNEIVGGILTYLSGVKARREENERWKLEWQRRQDLEALARAREERETRRREFVKRFVALSTEADELRSFLARLHERMPSSPSGDLVRMTDWVETRLQRLEGELTAEGISGALAERTLFPEVDDLAAPVPEEDSN